MGNKFITVPFGADSMTVLSNKINEEIKLQEKKGYLYHSMQFTSYLSESNAYYSHNCIVVFKKHKEKI